MVIIHLTGGLGNQLFQYALGKKMAILKQTSLKLDITGFETYKLHKYSLQHFNINEDFATEQEIRALRDHPDSFLRNFVKKIKNKITPNIKTLFLENGFRFDEKVFSSPENVYLKGYWQSEKYFKDIEPGLRKELIVKTKLQGKDEKIAGLISNTMPVGVHIRRTDYVSNKKTNQVHGTCTIEYYLEAMDFIAKKTESPHFFIFSDDFDWVKKNIISKYHSTYVDHNNADTNYEDLRLMSLCKHNIIANSSFSWWGAWLNNNKDKIVIAPSKWFNDNSRNTKDLIPEQWIRIR